MKPGAAIARGGSVERAMIEEDRTAALERIQATQTKASQLQRRLAAVARALGSSALGSSYEEGAEQHEQLAVNRRAPTTLDHRVQAKSWRALAERARLTADAWERIGTSDVDAVACPRCAAPIPRVVLLEMVLADITATCSTCGTVARVGLHPAGPAAEFTDELTVAVAQEGARVAHNLDDDILARLFAVGLRANDVMAMTEGQVHERLVEIVNDLDAGVRAIRHLALDLVRNPAARDGNGSPSP